MAGPTQSAQLLSQVEADGEVPLGSYDSWTLAAAGAGSPLHGLVLTDEMRAMTDDAFVARLAEARQELGYRAHPASAPSSSPNPARGRQTNGDAAAAGGGEGAAGPSVVEEFELPQPLNFIVAARREPAYVGLAYVADRDDVASAPQLHVGWRGIERVLHGVLAEDGRVGVLEERRDPQGVHEFVLRSPVIEAASLYDGFVARPSLSSDQLLSVHVFHPDASEPRHLEVRLAFDDEGAQTSSAAAPDGTGWDRVRARDDAQAGWVEFVSEALGVPRRKR